MKTVKANLVEEVIYASTYAYAFNERRLRGMSSKWAEDSKLSDAERVRLWTLECALLSIADAEDAVNQHRLGEKEIKAREILAKRKR